MLLLLLPPVMVMMLSLVMVLSCDVMRTTTTTMVVMMMMACNVAAPNMFCVHELVMETMNVWVDGIDRVALVAHAHHQWWANFKLIIGE